MIAMMLQIEVVFTYSRALYASWVSIKIFIWLPLNSIHFSCAITGDDKMLSSTKHNGSTTIFWTISFFSVFRF